MRTATEPQRGAGRQGHTWTVRPVLHVGVAPFNTKVVDEISTSVDVVGFMLGVYQVTRSDDVDWRALLTISASTDDQAGELGSRAYVQSVTIERLGHETLSPLSLLLQQLQLPGTVKDDPRPMSKVRDGKRTEGLQDTTLPLAQLLKMCLRAGAVDGVMHPAGTVLNGKKLKRPQLEWTLTQGKKPTPTKQQEGQAAGEKQAKYSSKDELHRAVLAALDEHNKLSQLGGIVTKRDAYVANAVNRNKENIRRDIRNALNWDKEQKERKKGGKR